MPFSEITPITIEVNAADIAAASSSSSSTSLVIAMQRLNDARQLPGQEPGEPVSQNQFSTFISPRFMNGNIVNAIDVLCATRVYSLDAASTLVILFELLGFKPSAPYTATIVHA